MGKKKEITRTFKLNYGNICPPPSFIYTFADNLHCLYKGPFPWRHADTVLISVILTSPYAVEREVRHGIALVVNSSQFVFTTL